MFQSTEELKSNMAPLVKAEPLIRDLATDLSLRGLVAGLEDALLGLKSQGTSSSMTSRASSTWPPTRWRT